MQRAGRPACWPALAQRQHVEGAGGRPGAALVHAVAALQLLLLGDGPGQELGGCHALEQGQGRVWHLGVGLGRGYGVCGWEVGG